MGFWKGCGKLTSTAVFSLMNLKPDCIESGCSLCHWGFNRYCSIVAASVTSDVDGEDGEDGERSSSAARKLCHYLALMALPFILAWLCLVCGVLVAGLTAASRQNTLHTYLYLCSLCPQFSCGRISGCLTATHAQVERHLDIFNAYSAPSGDTTLSRRIEPRFPAFPANFCRTRVETWARSPCVYYSSHRPYSTGSSTVPHISQTLGERALSSLWAPSCFKFRGYFLKALEPHSGLLGGEIRHHELRKVLSTKGMLAGKTS